MNLAIAVFVGLLTSVLLVAGVALLSRKVLLVRRMRQALYLAGIAAGLRVFTLFPSAISEVETLKSAVSFLLVLLGVFAFLQIAGLYFFDVYLHSNRGVRLPPLLPIVCMGAAYFIAGLTIYHYSYPDADLSAFVATSAVTSLVLGLALQPILGNFFAGVVISLEKPFRINDWIKFGETEGLVMDITWRTTHMRTRENDSLVIPNSVIAGEQITNYHYPHPLHMERIQVGVSYRTPPYRVREALLKATLVEGVLDKPTAEVCLTSFDDSSIAYELRFWIEDYAQRIRINTTVREAIWEKFRSRGITIPFPIRTLEWAPQEVPIQVASKPQETVEAPSTEGRAQLFVTSGIDQGLSLALNGEPVVVGRSRHCSLVLRESQASKEHLRISLRDGAFVLNDLGSQRGTRVNNCQVTETILRDLDRITIGDTEIVFENHV